MAHVQDALLDDDRSPGVEAHLNRCAACRDFAARLDALRTGAALLGDVVAPAPAADLAERVLSHVRTAGDGAGRQSDAPAHGYGYGAGAGVGVGERRRPWLTDAARRSLIRSTAIAAAALLVVGAMAVLARPGDDRHDVLLASAERTEAAGSARVTVEGETELAVPVEHVAPGNGGEGPARAARPPFEAFPPHVRGPMEEQWARAMAEFERQLAAFHAQVDEAIRRGQEQIDRALREAFGGGGRPPLPSPPTTRPAAPPRPPSALSLRFGVTAGGELDFRGRANLQGTVRPVVPASSLEGAPAGFAVSVDGRHAAVRAADGAWAQVQSGSGPVGSVLLEPGAVGRILRNAEGEVEDLGQADLDGTRVSRYRFDVDPSAMVRTKLAEHHWTAEAAVDGDGRVRALRLQSRGGVDRTSPLTWRADVTLRLHDFGTPVGPRPAAAAQAQAQGEGQAGTATSRSSVLVHPFGPSVAASLQAASSKTR